MASILYGIWIIGIFLIVVWSMRAERDPNARYEGFFGFTREKPSEPEGKAKPPLPPASSGR